MKIGILLKSFILTGLLCIIVSCNKDSEFLTEHPKSFNAPENTFVSTAGFQTAINGCYHLLEREYYAFVEGALYAGTDVVKNTNYGHPSFTAVENLGSELNSTFSVSNDIWNWCYTMIANANLIISNVNNPGIVWDSSSDKNRFEAEARFFRAYGYRMLSYLFGGVPIVKEVAKPFRLDYTRNTLNEVLDFMITDFTFAAANLPETPALIGQLVKAAAQQLLAEAYLYENKPDLAEPLLKAIISSGKYQLMTARFGVNKSAPGDVFSDLFLENNHNSTSGNKEGIMVVQLQYGYAMGSGYFRTYARRNWGPYYATIPGLLLCDTLGGRGIGALMPTDFWLNSYETADMRNSKFNIRRHFFGNNPAYPALYGKEIPITQQTIDNYQLYPHSTKFYFGKNSDPSYAWTDKDYYVVRLAGTYLLLAEAQIKLNKIAEATANINIVRARANATPVTQDKVNIDYLLDETARELFTETPRRYELVRNGKYLDRVTKYNPVAAKAVKATNALLPLPQVAIDANSGAKLEQNPGY